MLLIFKRRWVDWIKQATSSGIQDFPLPATGLPSSVVWLGSVKQT